MSSQSNRIAGFAVALSMICAGVGGALYRQAREMGPPPQDAFVSVDSRTLVASTDANPELSEGEFFFRLLELVRREFVDEVEDDQKLAVGAIRGMIASLSDPDAIFMAEGPFSAFKKTLEGQYQGVGIELELRYEPDQLEKYHEARKKLAEWNQSGRKEVNGEPEALPDLDPGALIPDVVVSAVIPGSPAERAGIKLGDMLDGVGGKFVINRREVKELNEAFDKIRKRQMDREAYIQLRQRYMQRTDNAIPFTRVREKLTLGTTGDIKVSWRPAAGGPVRTATLNKTTTTVKPLTGDQLRFVTGADQALAEAVRQGQTRFDLTNSGMGNEDAMLSALGALLPNPTRLLVRTGQSSAPIPLNVKPSGDGKARLQLVVDPTTVGAARVFAFALQREGLATLEGKLGAAPARLIEVVSLPGGSGYILPRGTLITSEVKR